MLVVFISFFYAQIFAHAISLIVFLLLFFGGGGGGSTTFFPFFGRFFSLFVHLLHGRYEIIFHLELSTEHSC